MDSSQLRDHLEPYGQSHILKFWDELPIDRQSALAEQIYSIDLAQVKELFDSQDAHESWSEIAAKAEPPPAITLEQFRDKPSYDAAYELGAEALRNGKVAMILTAGGQGSRLGFEHPKGMYPIGPISNCSLYQIILEKVRARSSQFGAPIPMFIMSSPPTHDESVRYLKEHQFFGFAPNDISVFCQGIMPAVDFDGKLILERKDQVFVSPDGHGGMLAAFEQSRCLEQVLDRGIEYIFYGQVDNPLIQACDPALIGYHIQAESEMTTQVVRKQDPLQKVGNVVSVDGRAQIIEYSDLPEDNARETNPDGSLKFWAGSIAVHIFNSSFLVRTSAQSDALPFHRATKKVPFIDELGNQTEPHAPNAIKFERFIFDLLSWANHAIVCEVDPQEGFCAVKNAPPATSETPQHVKQAISDLHSRWLAMADVCVEPGTTVEINPLFAVDAIQLAKKTDLPQIIDQPTYFN